MAIGILMIVSNAVWLAAWWFVWRHYPEPAPLLVPRGVTTEIVLGPGIVVRGTLVHVEDGGALNFIYHDKTENDPEAKAQIQAAVRREKA